METNHDLVPISNVSIDSPFISTGPVIHKPPDHTNTHPMVTCCKVGVHTPRILMAAIDTKPDLQLHEPANYKQACNHPPWKEAMEHEYSTLCRNQTWVLVPPSPQQKVIGC